MQVALWVGGIPLLHSQQPWRQSRATQTSRIVPAGERARQLSRCPLALGSLASGSWSAGAHLLRHACCLLPGSCLSSLSSFAVCMCVRQFIRELDPAGQAVCQLAVHPPDLMVRGHSKPTQSTVSSPLAPKCLKECGYVNH